MAGSDCRDKFTTVSYTHLDVYKRQPHTPEEGFKVISALLAHSPTIKIHVLSGQSDEANVKRALTLGAVDFIAKPCDVEKLKDMLLQSLKVQDVELNEIKAEQEFDGLLGDSLPMQALRCLLYTSRCV